MRQIEVIPAVPVARKSHRFAAGLALMAGAALVVGAAAVPAGAAERAYSAPSCSLAARLTAEGVVFDYSPPASSSVPRWFGLYSAAGVLLGQATLEPGSSSEPIEAAVDGADVQYAGTWLRLVDQLACSAPAPTSTTVPVPPTVPATVPETTSSTVATVVEIGVPLGPVTSVEAFCVVECGAAGNAGPVGVEVLSSSVATLPVSGRASGQLVILGVALLGLGVMTVRAARRF